MKYIDNFKKEDLKHNEIYYLDYSPGWLLKYDENSPSNSEVKGISIALDTKNFYKTSTGWGALKICNNIRLATNKEKAHLEACIKAGKYVEPEDIKEVNYEIY